MKHSIVKKMLMVMALSTSMVYAKKNNTEDAQWRNSLRQDENKGHSAKNRKNNRFSRTDSASSVGSLANKFESGAANNALGTPRQDPGIIPASPSVADTAAQFNAPAANVSGVQEVTANINELVPVHQDTAVPVSSAVPAPVPAAPNLDELLGMPANSVPAASANAMSNKELDDLLGTAPVAHQGLAPVLSNNVPAANSQNSAGLSGVDNLLGAPSVSTAAVDNAPRQPLTLQEADDLLGGKPLATNQNLPMVSSNTAPNLDELLGNNPVAHQDMAPVESHGAVAAPVVQDLQPLIQPPVLNLDAPKSDLLSSPVVGSQSSVSASDFSNSGSSVFSPQPAGDIASIAASAVNAANEIKADVAEHRHEMDVHSAAMDDHAQAMTDNAANVAANISAHNQDMDNHSAVISDTAQSIAATHAAIVDKVDEHKDAMAANAANLAATVQDHTAALDNHAQTVLSATAPAPVDMLPVAAPVAQQNLVIPAIADAQPQAMTQQDSGLPVSGDALATVMPLVPTSVADNVSGQLINPQGDVNAVPVMNPVIAGQNDMLSAGDIQPQVVQHDVQLQSQTDINPAATTAFNVDSAINSDSQQMIHQDTMPAVFSDTAQHEVIPAAVELPKLPADVIEKIEVAAKRSADLQSRVGAIASKALVDAEIAAAKASNDMKDAHEQQKITDSLASITGRLTSLLKESEDKSRSELEAIYKELDGIEQEIMHNSGIDHVSELPHDDVKPSFAAEENRRDDRFINDIPFSGSDDLGYGG